MHMTRYFIAIGFWTLCSQVAASPELASKYDCFSCHSVEYRVIGPAYRDVALRYGEYSQAYIALAARIRSGGSGKWGKFVMPAQPKVSEAESLELAQWILSLSKSGIDAPRANSSIPTQ